MRNHEADRALLIELTSHEELLEIEKIVDLINQMPDEDLIEVVKIVDTRLIQFMLDKELIDAEKIANFLLIKQLSDKKIETVLIVDFLFGCAKTTGYVELEIHSEQSFHFRIGQAGQETLINRPYAISVLRNLLARIAVVCKDSIPDGTPFLYGFELMLLFL